MPVKKKVEKGRMGIFAKQAQLRLVGRSEYTLMQIQVLLQCKTVVSNRRTTRTLYSQSSNPSKFSFVLFCCRRVFSEI